MADTADGKRKSASDKDGEDGAAVGMLRTLLQLLAAVGGGTAALAGVTAGVALLAHTAHLRMLGIPYFPLAQSSYCGLALDYALETSRIAAAGVPVWRLVVIVVGVGTILIFLACLRRPQSPEASWWGRCEHLLYVALLAFGVALGGFTVCRCARMLAGGAVSLASERRDLNGEFGPAAPAGRHEWLRAGLFGLTSTQTRVCLFWRGEPLPLWARGKTDICGGIFMRGNETGQRVLERNYATAARFATLLGLVLVGACRWRERLLRAPPHPKSGARSGPGRGCDWSFLLRGADMLLGIPLLVEFVLVMALLPGDYGAVIRNTRYPAVFFENESGAESDAPPVPGDADRLVYLLSGEQAGATTIHLLGLRWADGQAGGRHAFHVVASVRTLPGAWSVRWVGDGNVLYCIRRFNELAAADPQAPPVPEESILRESIQR